MEAQNQPVVAEDRRVLIAPQARDRALAGTRLAGKQVASAVLIGVDLGPNLSITGSLATILWLIALRKQGLDVGFLRFLKVGALAMPAALLAAIGGALLTNLLFRSG